MTKSFAGMAGLIVLILLLFTGYSSIFTVHQAQNALLLRFGEPVPGRAVVSQPGLHFKAPFIENVVYFDNRILDLETPKQEVLASDNNRIEVDAFLRYKIVDILQFYRSVRTIDGGNNQLGSVLNSAVRRVLGEATMLQLVRDDRNNLMRKILDQVNLESAKLGMNVVDVRIRRADLPRQISEQVFRRMQTERAREAADYRAQGSEQAQRITAKADRDVIVIRADAQRQADQTRGEGDAERNKIFAEAYGKDPDFFAFYRSMQAYETGLKSADTRFVISPNSEFFRYFGKSNGGGAPTPAATAKPGN
ncbi:protease modulator HflC [Roseiarcaceae bacterium H3SJ34-1]|uniref:protease modulator HflC n=1 Tax=Terripilifer ovatus TaxID=3032367 RepID=UPI003AB949A8|nr:protease modulator HflC [Roseiarcaceae bacterium H3SJ34-1]